MKKKLKVIIIVTITIILLITAWNVRFYKESFSYVFKVEVIPNGDGNFTVYLPVPITKDGNVSPVVSDWVIKNPDYEIIETMYGRALKISGNRSIVIEIKGNEKCDESFFSMRNKTPLLMDEEMKLLPYPAWDFYVGLNRSLDTKSVEIYACWDYRHKFGDYNVFGFRLGPLLAGETICYSRIDGVVLTEDGWQVVEGMSSKIVV